MVYPPPDRVVVIIVNVVIIHNNYIIIYIHSVALCDGLRHSLGLSLLLQVLNFWSPLLQLQ